MTNKYTEITTHFRRGVESDEAIKTREVINNNFGDIEFVLNKYNKDGEVETIKLSIDKNTRVEGTNENGNPCGVHQDGESFTVYLKEV